MPKVSVIMPVYNVEKYIAETISSVLAQTFTDFELLVIDDESKDTSIEICEGFTDARIQIIHQKNRGLAGARNTGIRHAKGEYLAFLDSDDVWRSQKLEKHVQHLDANPAIGVSFCSSEFIDDDSQPLGNYQIPQIKNITPELVLCRNPISNGSVPVIRKAVFQDIEFIDNFYGTEEKFYFDDRFRQSEDIECWIRIVLTTKWQLEGIPEALTLYRVNSGGLSANMIKQLDSWEKVIAKTRTYAPQFLAQWESLARAYQLRYLARRAIRNQDRQAGVALVNRALASNWKILIYEPQRTLLTMFAAYSIWILPRGLYNSIESFALQLTGKSQRKAIAKNRT
ncbi:MULTISPECIES: glycosyltransferase family 2 protein [Pseudanabaena]|uniref:Glycosyl transferase family 2 n=2 Tax=Pseudanabaena TaxID=1152 RepID=L8N396_9CYAN|nr:MULTISPECIES: glycosyltransferase family 2 protein [Pseudanabaena]ELS34712.1 glycosyl transferase family 2 [Pseudanabaena biceps PCC 7429]MDG3493054.1 glycosyltransferase family 2 protein [Pseudanabaena catenata USMAC16]